MTPCTHSRRGAVLVELVLVLVATVLLLPYVLLLARLCLYRLVLEQAVDAAARYLASVPIEAMRDPAQQAVARGVAQALVQDAARAAGLEAAPASPTILCDGINCDMLLFGSSIGTVQVGTVIEFSDPYFHGINAGYGGAATLTIIAKYRYGD